MAIKFEDIYRKLSEKVRKEIADFEKLLDAWIEMNYEGGKQQIPQNIDLPKTQEARRVLMDKYKAAGWKLHFDYDQKESQHWATIEPNARPNR